MLPEAAAASLRQVRDAAAALSVSRELFPSLAVIGRQHGPAKAGALVKAYLMELCDMVNLKRPLNARQIDAIAGEVAATYYSLTVADLHVIFRRAKTGAYGELYESLDMPKVLGWFQAYFDERCEAAAAQAVTGQHHDKGGNITPARVARQFETLTKKMTKK